MSAFDDLLQIYKDERAKVKKAIRENEKITQGLNKLLGDIESAIDLLAKEKHTAQKSKRKT